MKNWKLFVTPLFLAAALLLASTCQAQTPNFLVAGSSALFNAVAVSAESPDPITSANGPCTGVGGTFNWTTKSSGTNLAAGIDPRAGVPAEPGNLWVVWGQDNSVPPNITVVCAYLSVDSMVGQRLLYGVDATGKNATLSLGAAATSTTGDNAVPYLPADQAALPAAVYAILNGAQIQAAMTDIRPEDGQFAVQRAQQAVDSLRDGLGYGPSPLGTAVQSAFTATSAQVIAYNLSGTDPISGGPVTPGQTISIGADPIIWFVNKSSTVNPGDFGSLNPTNILSHTAAQILAGYLGRTVDVSGTQGVAPQPLTVVIREPISGTYNTVEWQIVRAKGTALSQEYGINPATQNPAIVAGPGGSVRERAIGTGEMIKQVNAITNAIGYAFWGYSNFSGKANVKYLKLDDVDPLFQTYTNGAFPTATGVAPSITLSAPVPNFANILDGGYRNWSTIRMILPKTVTYAGSFFQQVINATQDQAHSTLPDFVPYQYCANAACSSYTPGLPVFRSHYNINGITGVDPTIPAYHVEQGGDMAGAIENVQSDLDYFADSGHTALLTGFLQ